jgi:DNA-binding transcriptional regulator GbsR (MarR family)
LFFNPDLSKVSGVSPSYWIYANDEIVQASPEERKRRDEYHNNKPPENTVSFKQVLDDFHQELSNDLQENIKEINNSIEDLECVDQQIINTLDAEVIELQLRIDSNQKEQDLLNNILKVEIMRQEKHIEILKLSVLMLLIFTIFLKIL